MSSVDGLGSGPGSAAAAGPSTTSLMEIVYEAQAGAATALDQAGVGSLAQKQCQDLMQALLDRDETLTNADKRAFERGDTAVVKAVLKRIQQRRLEAHQRIEQQAQLEAKRGADGLTQSRIPVPQDAAREDLPLGEADAGAANEMPGGAGDARTPSRGQAVDQGELDGGLLRSRAPVESPATLAEAKQTLLRLVAQSATEDVPVAATARRSGAQSLGQSGFEPGSGRRAKLLGTAQAAAESGALPRGGFSGEADSLPVLQFMPAALVKLLDRLGIRTLADFLARAAQPAGRLVLAQMLGLPTTTLLLLVRRAELLDLPLVPGRGQLPHTKDAVLLARLGAGSIERLALLGRGMGEGPERLEILAALLAALQKRRPEWVGRQRITKHDLRNWMAAAAHRGSQVKIGRDPAFPLESTADAVLSWYQAHQWKDADAAFDGAVAQALLLLRQQGMRPDATLLARLEAERGEAARRQYEEVLREHRAEDDARERLVEAQNRAADRYAAYLADAADGSLLTDLHPWVCPDLQRTDGLICFWMDPVPDGRHLMVTGPGETPTQSLQAVYVCMDPVSGAIAPFGAGVG